jgi:hypothetical protein
MPHYVAWIKVEWKEDKTSPDPRDWNGETRNHVESFETSADNAAREEAEKRRVGLGNFPRATARIIELWEVKRLAKP